MKKKKRRISKRALKKAAFVCVILVLVLVMVYSGLQILESTVLRNASDDDQKVISKTITRGDVDYFPRQDITTFLIMGIDRQGKVEDSGSYHNPGSADVVMLAVFDEIEEVYSIVYLNRDTMLTMPVLGVGGKQAGTLYGQLALAHTYGSGLKDSCENVRQTVSDFLYGIRIDYYVAMNMDAITILNDAVGGVTVTVTEDFSGVDKTIGKGKVTLTGEQAVNYVRSRKDVGDQLNLSRMERQQDYIEGFLTALKEKNDGNPRFLTSVYSDVEDYLVSDCPVSSLAGMVEYYGEFDLDRIVSPKGENVMGEKYMEFYVDEEDLDAIILDIFYAPKEFVSTPDE